MENAKRITIILTLILLTTGTVISKESQISNTRTASCIVKITTNPGILQLNYEIIDSLMRSSSISGKAGREVLNLPPGQDYDLFIIEILHSNPIGSIQQDIYPPLHMYESFGGERSSQPRSPGRRMDEEETSEYEYEMMMMQEMGRGMADFAPQQPNSSRSRSRGSDTRTTTRSGRRTGTPSPPARTARSSVQSPPAEAVQTFLYRLDVELPDDVKPLAEEFAKALVNNLRETLNNAYEAYHREVLFGQLHGAEAQRDRAQSQLEDAIKEAQSAIKIPTITINESDAAVYEQLEEVVDLSELRPEMTFEQVLNILMNKVAPPLQIKPNWRELEIYAEVDRSTISDMDPLTRVKLGKAIDVLLAGLSDPDAPDYRLSYILDEGIITIATKEIIKPKMITVVYEISGLIHTAADRNSLIKAIKETIKPDSWFDNSDASEGTVNPVMGNKLAIYQTPEIHRKIQKFLKSMPIEIPTVSPVIIPEEMHQEIIIISEEKQRLVREKRGLEINIARLEARQRAIEEQIARISEQTTSKIKDDTITAELERLLKSQTQQLANLKMALERGQMSLNELASAEERLFRTKIELVQRQEQLVKSRGGDQLVRYNADLADITIELAEKRAEILVVDEQLNHTENQLATTSSIDPRVEQIRMAKEALDRAQNRVNELNMRIANLQPPTVTVIGVD